MTLVHCKRTIGHERAGSHFSVLAWPAELENFSQCCRNCMPGSHTEVSNPPISNVATASGLAAANPQSRISHHLTKESPGPHGEEQPRTYHHYGFQPKNILVAQRGSPSRTSRRSVAATDQTSKVRDILARNITAELGPDTYYHHREGKPRAHKHGGARRQQIIPPPRGTASRIPAQRSSAPT